MTKRIIILGSTGSIGINTLNVIRGLGNGYKVAGLSAWRNINRFVEQINEFKPEIAVLADETKKKEFENKLKAARVSPATKIFYGIDGLIRAARFKNAGLLVSAMVGAVGLVPTLEAIKAGKDIALANKEILVIAGDIITRAANRYKVKILPLDSEHSAVFQCLQGEKIEDVRKIILTASGGPFYRHKLTQLKRVTAREALKHPTWNMGAKISVDSADLMNKGLEIIEAHHLFKMDINRIEILIHAQSVVHSMVELVDGSVLAQLGVPDMRVPIQYALSYPSRIKSSLKKLDLAEYGKLTFENPDFKRFPCLSLAIKAGRLGGTMPVVLNAANEIAVQAFLSNHIRFTDIPLIVGAMMNKHKAIKNTKLEDIIETDRVIRIKTKEACNIL